MRGFTVLKPWFLLPGSYFSLVWCGDGDNNGNIMYRKRLCNWTGYIMFKVDHCDAGHSFCFTLLLSKNGASYPSWKKAYIQQNRFEAWIRNKKADRVNVGEVPELNDISDIVVLQQSSDGVGGGKGGVRSLSQIFCVAWPTVVRPGEGGLMGAGFPLAESNKTLWCHLHHTIRNVLILLAKYSWEHWYRCRLLWTRRIFISVTWQYQHTSKERKR
jgi:hypothetical protein